MPLTELRKAPLVNNLNLEEVNQSLWVLANRDHLLLKKIEENLDSMDTKITDLHAKLESM